MIDMAVENGDILPLPITLTSVRITVSVYGC